MKPQVVYPDVEPIVVDLLAGLLDSVGEDVTVDVGVPTDWTRLSPPHLEVDHAGTPLIEHPIRAFPTVRIVVHAATTTEAKRLALLAQGLLLAHSGHGGTDSIEHLTGVLPAKDPRTKAEMASIGLRVGVRSEPIVPAGS